MPVAVVWIRVAFDEGIRRDRHRARVGLALVRDDLSPGLSAGSRPRPDNGMPIALPGTNPAPKSGCNGAVAPMKAMILAEFGSTGTAEMSVFHALSLGNGTEAVQVRARTDTHTGARAALRQDLAGE